MLLYQISELTGSERFQFLNNESATAEKITETILVINFKKLNHEKFNTLSCNFHANFHFL